MSVALYDDDVVRYGLIPFNLELMKLAAYYKSKNEIVVMQRKFDPDPYSKFIIRKDVADDVFPPHFNMYPQVEYGGLGFTNNKYVPLPENVDARHADTSIYEKLHSIMVTKKSYELDFGVQMRALHMRISRDGQHLWDHLESQIDTEHTATLFLHDKAPSLVEDGYAMVKELLERLSWPRAKTRLGSKFPIDVFTFEDLVRWARFPLSRFSTFCYHHYLEDEDFIRVTQYISRAAFNKGSMIPTIGWSSENQFIEHGLPQIYRQLIFSCNQRKRFSLIYDDNFFTDQRWEKVFTLINLFAQAAHDWKFPTSTMVYFCKNLYTINDPNFKRAVMRKEEAREVFQFVFEYCPELFDMFKYCRTITERGGKLYYERELNPYW